MKKLEIVEIPISPVFILIGMLSENVHYTKNPNDVFGAVKKIFDVPENFIPKGLKEGIWEHFKGGRYRVYGFAYRGKTNEVLVIYQSLYNSQKYPKGTFWGRSADEFLGYKVDGDEKIKRFTYVE